MFNKKDLIHFKPFLSGLDLVKATYGILKDLGATKDVSVATIYRTPELKLWHFQYFAFDFCQSQVESLDN
ncbi:hypothetical protein BpHYR1_048587 [Brachionus plicatilis]|uniref:Uncharacterized protein n=1 Tax=Brachionus plicatilis TaxID=10195 RepID=A0A3M7PQG2_BRAPC|nr:hypothetical protein BpHYR1_048587 [Brachionus plicatilis]